MSFKSIHRNMLTFAVLAACAGGASSLHADTIYTYTGLSTITLNGTGAMSIQISVPGSGAALANLPAGTNVSLISMTDGGPPPVDLAGFPGTDFSLTALSSATALPAAVAQIGTDALGNITSWNINQSYFISFPAFAGEDPADFYGEYKIVSSNAGDQTQLIVEHDADFSPGSTSVANIGTWSPTFTAAPEPASLGMLTLGAAGLLARRQRRA